jgi:hypothetical protein
MGMVLIVQLFLVGFIYYWASIRAVLHQTSFFFMAAGQAFRLALYFVIFIESIINSVLPDILDIALSKLTLIIVIVMLCCNVLHILISIMSNSIKSAPKPLNVKNKLLLESKSTTTKSKTKKTRVQVLQSSKSNKSVDDKKKAKTYVRYIKKTKTKKQAQDGL